MLRGGSSRAIGEGLLFPCSWFTGDMWAPPAMRPRPPQPPGAPTSRMLAQGPQCGAGALHGPGPGRSPPPAPGGWGFALSVLIQMWAQCCPGSLDGPLQPLQLRAGPQALCSVGSGPSGSPAGLPTCTYRSPPHPGCRVSVARRCWRTQPLPVPHSSCFCPRDSWNPCPPQSHGRCALTPRPK